MTVTITFLNDQSQQPAVYIDRTDLDHYTLRIATDSATPATIPSLRIRFPVTIVALGKPRVATPGWSGQSSGPSLTLTSDTSVNLTSVAPLVLQLTGVSTDKDAATTDELQVSVAGEAPTAKLFLMRFPTGAANLTRVMLPKLLPETVYRTPEGHGPV